MRQVPPLQPSLDTVSLPFQNTSVFLFSTLTLQNNLLAKQLSVSMRPVKPQPLLPVQRPSANDTSLMLLAEMCSVR